MGEIDRISPVANAALQLQLRVKDGAPRDHQNPSHSHEKSEDSNPHGDVVELHGEELLLFHEGREPSETNCLDIEA